MWLSASGVLQVLMPVCLSLACADIPEPPKHKKRKSRKAILGLVLADRGDVQVTQNEAGRVQHAERGASKSGGWGLGQFRPCVVEQLAGN